jgi:hypothetical protein
MKEAQKFVKQEGVYALPIIQVLVKVMLAAANHCHARACAWITLYSTQLQACSLCDYICMHDVRVRAPVARAAGSLPHPHPRHSLLRAPQRLVPVKRQHVLQAAQNTVHSDEGA